jgi:CBS domain-containing protein
MATVMQVLKAKSDKAVHTIDAAARVLDAISVMSQKSIGALVVTTASGMCGIVTERDYARKVVLQHRSSKDTRVDDIMTVEVISVGPHEASDKCMVLMTTRHIRHLPVIGGDGQLLGLVSIGDLVKNIIEEQKFAIDQLERYVHGGIGQHAAEAV